MRRESRWRSQNVKRPICAIRIEPCTPSQLILHGSKHWQKGKTWRKRLTLSSGASAACKTTSVKNCCPRLPGSLVGSPDVVAYSERMGWVENAEEFIGARKLRNLLVHEYMTEPELFCEALFTAKTAAQMLFHVVVAIKTEATTCGLLLSGRTAAEDK
ncbi:MAG: hypothetical protein Q8M11_14990 [Sulfuritalea sp.]|nr:hypothetical protein [Sulfuritalea sp.]